MASTVAVLAVRFVVDAGAAITGIEAMANRSRLASSGMLFLGAAAATAAVGVMALATEATVFGIKTAGSMEQARVAMTAMLGSADKANAHLQALYAFARETPFSMESVIDASRRLMAFGFAAETNIKMLRSIGDVAAGLNVGEAGINRIVLALGQMHSASRLMASDMRQLTELGIPAWQVLAEHLGITVQQAQELTTKGKIAGDTMVTAFLNMTGPLQRFQGMMAAQNKTFLGQWQIMKDTIVLGMGQMFTPAITALNRIMPQIIAGITSIMQGATPVLGSMFNDFISNTMTMIALVKPLFVGLFDIVKAVGAAFSSVSGPLQAVQNGMKGEMINALVKLLPPLKEFAVLLAGEVAKAIVASLPAMRDWGKAAGEFIKQMGPMMPALGLLLVSVIRLVPLLARLAAVGMQGAAIMMMMSNQTAGLAKALAGALAAVVGWVVAVLTGTRSAGNDISSVWSKVAGFFVELWSGIVGVWNSIWASVTGFFKNVWGGISSFFQGIWNGIVGVVMVGVNAIRAVLEFFAPIINFFVALWQLGFEIVKTVVIVAWEVLSTIFAFIQAGIMAVVNVVWGFLVAQWTMAWNFMASVLRGFWGIVTTVWGLLVQAWTGIAEATVALWQAHIQPIFDAIGQGLRFLYDTFFVPFWNGVLAGWKLLMDGVNFLKNVFIAAWAGVVSGVKGGWDWLMNTLDKITEKIKKAIDWLRNLQDFVQKGGDWIKGLLPGRAMGGPVMAGTPYLVGERGPEVFVPNTMGAILPNSFLNPGTGSKVPPIGIQSRSGGSREPSMRETAEAMAQAIAAALLPVVAQMADRPVVVKIGSQELVFASQEGERSLDRRG